MPVAFFSRIYFLRHHGLVAADEYWNRSLLRMSCLDGSLFWNRERIISQKGANGPAETVIRTQEKKYPQKDCQFEIIQKDI